MDTLNLLGIALLVTSYVGTGYLLATMIMRHAIKTQKWSMITMPPWGRITMFLLLWVFWWVPVAVLVVATLIVTCNPKVWRKELEHRRRKD